MASSVQFENTYAEDERWLEAGANAFALHFAACCYSDRRNKDGAIPKSMVYRVCLAVPPESIQESIETLIRLGFWTQKRDQYFIVDYLENKIGLPAEEKENNRRKWAADKRWRRRHNVGVHDECPPEKCRISGKVSHSDSTGDSTTESAKSPSEVLTNTTRPDSLRPDSTRLDYGVGERVRVGGRRNSRPSDSAGAPSPASRSTPEKPVDVIDNPYGPPPYGVSVESWVKVMRMSDAGELDDDDAADGLDGLIPAGAADSVSAAGR